jgi:hypothetical protein
LGQPVSDWDRDAPREWVGWLAAGGSLTLQSLTAPVLLAPLYPQVFIMLCFPRFTHFRLMNVIGLVTVGYTALYVIVVASQGGLNAWAIKGWASTSQEWFNGATIWLPILGTHAVTMETLESMEQPKHFKAVSRGGAHSKVERELDPVPLTTNALPLLDDSH